MIAYNKTSLDRRQLQTIIDQLSANKLLSPEEVKNIKAAYPSDLYSPSIFVRIGYGILTLIANGAAFGIVLLMSGGSGIRSICFFMALLSIGALEFFIREKKHYRSGVDDVLFHLAVIYLIAGFTFDFSNDSNMLITGCLIAIGCYIVGTIRYLNRLAAALIPVAAWCFIFSLFRSGIPIPVYFIAAAAMAALLLFFNMLEKQNRWPYHRDCLHWATFASAIACYASLHYHCYQTLRYIGYYGSPEPGATNLWTIFLWCWTIVVPFVFLGYGIRKASISWIWLGMVAVLSLGYFYHHYLSILSPEVGAILVGLIITCLAGYIILYLQQKKSKRFEYEPGINSDDLLIPASLVGMIRIHTPAADGSTSFGGGSFGGGGAGGDF
ncbi:MAG: hypothetical protein LCH51_07315 [Bacteroidetes bacterium]|nr:hypothetical protein [Bacteroidota bacterium]